MHGDTITCKVIIIASTIFFLIRLYSTQKKLKQSKKAPRQKNVCQRCKKHLTTKWNLSRHTATCGQDWKSGMQKVIIQEKGREKARKKGKESG